MAKANSYPTDKKAKLQQQLDKLEAKRIVMRSKCNVLIEGLQALDQQIEDLKSRLSQ